MAVHFLTASPFEENRLRIEDFIFRTIVEIQNDVEAAIRSVDTFAKAIDKFIDTTEQMYKNPRALDSSGERSSPVGDGRYRIFYKIAIRPDNDFEITLLDIDDNRESNLDRFPVHRLRTFVSDE
jgi:hypothetical protein